MRKIKFLVAFVLLGSLLWYLFIKPNDYMVRFKIKTSPGNIFTGVEEWNLVGQASGDFSYKINEKKSYEYINQTLKIDSLDLNVNWKFKSVNDSITQVYVGVLERKHSVYNRITAPFSNTVFKETVINAVKGFKDGIDTQLKQRYLIKHIDTVNTPEIQYAYIEIKNVKMRDKAAVMMNNNAALLDFITEHDLKDGDFPFIIVNKWDLDNNLIDFRYCFPIKVNDSIIENNIIKFDRFTSKKALKAVYYGNYMTSDRAWFALHEYAKRHHITVKNKPLEIFYNNPFDGGIELKWKAEVYMPIK